MIKRANSTDSVACVNCMSAGGTTTADRKQINWKIDSCDHWPTITRTFLVAWLADGFAQFSCLDPLGYRRCRSH